MFTTDIHLLALEPLLFRDVSWLSQRLLLGSCDVAGDTLTLTASDNDLEDANVTAGHVAVIGGVAHEIVERLSDTTARVSRLRALAIDPIIPPAPGTGLAITIHTFAPQIAIVHAQLLRMAGSPDESQVTNAHDLALVESFGALHLIYAAASALSPPDSALALRAGLYRARFAEERARALLKLDLDGDAVPDATRRLNLIHLARA